MRRFLLSFVLVFAFSLFGKTEYGIQSRGEHAIPLDWSTCTFDAAINETFRIKLEEEDENNLLVQEYSQMLRHNGINIAPILIEKVKELKGMFELKIGRHHPHIALVRILLYGNDGNCYVYNIPYVFLSTQQFIGKLIAEENLRPAFKNIFSFNFVSDVGYAQHFAHSERAIGLFFTNTIILRKIIEHFNVTHLGINIQRTTIQIMTLNPICIHCSKFWERKSYVLDTNNAQANLFTNDSNHAIIFNINRRIKRRLEPRQRGMRISVQVGRCFKY